MEQVSLERRVEILEQQVESLSLVPSKIAAMEEQFVQRLEELRLDVSATVQESEGKTRREMAALHADCVSRLELLVQGRATQHQTELLALHKQAAARLEELIRDGDDETRRFMRMLYEEVIERIARIGEGGRPPKP